MISSRNSVDIEALSHFISELNKWSEHHVGYCGVKQEEILDTLMNNFSDLRMEDSFSVIYQDNEIIAALGLDVSLEDKEAELWGPFINQKNWQESAKILWNDISEKIGARVDTFHGFFNEKNIQGNVLMNTLGADKKGKHLTLKADNKGFIYQKDSEIREISESMHADFIKLHEDAFPGSYYSGAEILNKLDKYNKIFTIVNDSNLAGYVYIEGNPSFHEGNIEFIAVAPNHRNKGIATRLIKSALHFLFAELEIKEISICVNTANNKAINLYKKAGFAENHVLNHFILKKSSVKASC